MVNHANALPISEGDRNLNPETKVNIVVPSSRVNPQCFNIYDHFI